MLNSRGVKGVALATLIAGLVLAHSATANAKQRLEVTFKKTAQDAAGVQWLGSGIVNGPGFSHPVGIEAVWPLDARRPTGKVIHVNKFLFGIWDPDFDNVLVVFEMKGIINTSNGRIIFNGKVIQSTVPLIPVGSKAQLRSQANAAFNMTMGSVMVTVP